MAQDEKDPDSPATTSEAADLMMPRWAKMNAVLGGTEAMRAQGETYLPKHQAETEDSYKARLNETVLRNFTTDTLDNLVGKPFSAPVTLNEGVPEVIKEELWPDLDQQGNSGDMVLRGWFRDGLAKAFSHMLVDFPKVKPRADGQPRTLDDDRKEGLRPYWVPLKPEMVIDAHCQIINGKEELTHLRFWRYETVKVGFIETMVAKIQVMEPGLTQIWIKKQDKNKKDVWVTEDEWQTGLTIIPLVTFYSDRQDFMLGRSPLDDLADLNITHWQSTSDQRHILKVARFPLLACSGAHSGDSSPVVIGPDRILYNEDAAGRFYYVEHTGAAINAGWKDLEQLENHMSSFGAQFLSQQVGDQTATAKAIDTAEVTCDLVSMVLLFEDAVAKALDVTAQWLRLGVSGGTISLEKDYNAATYDQPGLTELREARKAKEISRKAYLEGLKARNILPENFDLEEDWEELMDEPASPGAAGFNIDPFQPEAPLPNEVNTNQEDQNKGETPPKTNEKTTEEE